MAALDEMAQKNFRGTLKPLDESEAWGRKIEERIATLSPKDQEKMYRWIGARR